MAKIKVLGSGSKGNCYLIVCEKETLILELGVPFAEVFRALNYDISSCVGALVSHEHKDHAMYISNAQRYGIGVFSCKSVSDSHADVKTLKTQSKTKIGGFRVQPINIKHSCECYAFIIEHEEIGKMLFVTDAISFRYKIKNCHHLFIESNWSEDIVIDNMCNGAPVTSAYKNHMSFDEALSTIKANFCGITETITLIHLSDGNSNAPLFSKKVSDALGFDNVYCAKKGLEIELKHD